MQAHFYLIHIGSEWKIGDRGQQFSLLPNYTIYLGIHFFIIVVKMCLLLPGDSENISDRQVFLYAVRNIVTFAFTKEAVTVLTSSERVMHILFNNKSAMHILYNEPLHP